MQVLLESVREVSWVTWEEYLRNRNSINIQELSYSLELNASRIANKLGLHNTSLKISSELMDSIVHIYSTFLSEDKRNIELWDSWEKVSLVRRAHFHMLVPGDPWMNLRPCPLPNPKIRGPDFHIRGALMILGKFEIWGLAPRRRKLGLAPPRRCGKPQKVSKGGPLRIGRYSDILIP